MVDKREVLAPGTVLIDDKGNEYVLGEILGKGSSGLVYKAKKENSELILAIKEIFPIAEGIVRAEDGLSLKVQNDSTELMSLVKESAKRELEIGSLVSEGNANAEAFYEQLDICAVHRPDGQMVYAVQESEVEGIGYITPQFYLSVSLKGKAERLFELVHNNYDRMQILDCLSLFEKCLAAIEKMHDLDVVHLDISAKNMYLFGCDADKLDWGVCMVIDFGTAQQISKDGIINWGNRASFCSPGFGAPELRQGKFSLVSKRTDVYSLGVLLYHILYGGRELQNGERAKIMSPRAKVLGAYRWLDDINDILLKATSKNIDTRYEDAGAFRTAIGDLINNIKSPEELIAPIDVPRDFENREEELNSFLGKLEKRHRLHIWGESGMGKTTFAAMLLERYKAKHPDAKVLFVRYMGETAEKTKELSDSKKYSGIKKAITMLTSNKEPIKDTQSANIDILSEERFQRNIRILNRYNSFDVLFIDNFYMEKYASIHELRKEEGTFYSQIESLPMKLVISTRYMCDDDEHLGPLSQAKLDETFFNNDLLSIISLEKRVHFYRLLGWNTYLIQLAMSSILEHSALSFHKMYRSLCEMETGFEVDSYKDGTYTTAQFQVLLERVWNVLALSPEEQTVLYICAVLVPERGIEAEILDRSFCESEYAKVIFSLIKKNWIIWSETEKRYIIHDMARVLARKHIDKENEVWKFLWGISERGETKGCSSMFAYADVNKRIKSGIFHYGNRDYKRGYHCFYNCLSTMKTIDEECVLWALDGITRCLDQVSYLENERFVDLCEEQIVHGLNSFNLHGIVLVGSDSKIVIDEAYKKCISSLCSLLITKHGYEIKPYWNESKKRDYIAAYFRCAKSRGWRHFDTNIYHASYTLAIEHEEDEFKEEFIKRIGGRYSHITRILIDIVWSFIPSGSKASVPSDDRGKRFVEKMGYMQQVKDAFRKNRFAKWVFKDSVMGLIDYLSSCIFSALNGLLSVDDVCQEVDTIIPEIEQVDSLMLPKIYLYYGMLLAANGKYDEASDYYIRFANNCSESVLDKRIEELFYRKLSEAFYAQNALWNAVETQRLALALYAEHYDEYVFDTKKYWSIFGSEGNSEKFSRKEIMEKCANVERLVHKNELEAAYSTGRYSSMNLIEEYCLLFQTDFEESPMAVSRVDKHTVDIEELHTLNQDTVATVPEQSEYYDMIGEARDSLKVQEVMLDLKKRFLGEEHPETIGSMYILADLYSRVGEGRKAQKIFEVLLGLKIQQLGKEHQETMLLMGTLANVYIGNGDSKNALVLFEELLEIKRKTDGDNYTEIIPLLESLSNIYLEKGEFQKEVELQEELLQLRTQLLGERHPDTLGSMTNLANSYSRAENQLEKAIGLYESTWELSELVLGMSHPSTLMVMNNLAGAYRKNGENQKAFKLFEQTYERVKQAREEGHPELLVMMHNLAISYFDMGEKEKAWSLFKMNMESMEKAFGPKSRERIEATKNYAAFCYKVGEKKEALELYTTALQVSTIALGEEHQETRDIEKIVNGLRMSLHNVHVQSSLDEKQAYELKAQITINHDAALQCKLAAMHLEGRGVVLSAVKAVELYQSAAEQGNSAAMFCLAILYMQGRGVHQDIDKAFDLFKKVAEQGHPNAQFMISLFYGTGRIVNRNDELARKWYEQALQNGIIKKAYDVNKLFLDCDDARNNLGLLVAWHEHTSYQQFSISRCNFAYMYEKGWGVDLDKGKAKEWYEKAAAQGDVIAKERVKSLRKPSLLGKLIK